MSTEISQDNLIQIIRDNTLKPVTFIEQIDVNLTSVTFIRNQFKETRLAEVLNFVCGQVSGLLDVSDVERKFYQKFFPVVKNVFNQALSSIQDDVRSSGSKTSHLIQVCCDLLTALNLLIANVLSYKEVNACSIETFARVVPELILLSFVHCKDSEAIYQSYFNEFADKLTFLFRKTYEVHTSYVKFVEEIARFDCTLENDVVLLTDVIENIGKIGEVTVGLDIKTLPDQWKGYVKLVHKYCDHLKQRLDISKSIVFLASCVQKITFLTTDIHNPLDDKAKLKYLKLGSFTLKIIIKLCEEFEGSLGECHKELTELLICIHGCGREVSLENEDVAQNTALESHISVGGGPLLAHLLSDIEIAKEFLKVADNADNLTSDSKLGLLLCWTNITGKLVQAKPHVQQLWLELDFLKSTMNIVQQCNFELNLHIEHTVGDVYSGLVSGVAALIAVAVSEQQFHKTELILFQSLLKPELYPVLFVQDLICLLNRLGSEQLTNAHISCLIKLLSESSRWERLQLNTVNVTTTLCRLVNLLSPHEKANLLSKYPLESHLYFWKEVGYSFLSPSNRISASETTLTLCKQRMSILESSNELTPHHFLELIEVLGALPSAVDSLRSSGCCSNVTQILPDILKLWNALVEGKPETIPNIPDKSSQWWVLLFVELCANFSSFLHFWNPEQISKVLQCITSLYPALNMFCKIKLISTISCLGSYEILSGSESTLLSNLFTQIFITILQDASDPLIVHLGLEAFSMFAHSTSHENIVSDIVNHNVQLQSKIVVFLKGKQLVKGTTTRRRDYLTNLMMDSSEFEHHCTSKLNSCNSQENPSEDVLVFDSPDMFSSQPSKKLKTDAGHEDKVNALVSKINSDLQTLGDLLRETQVLPSCKMSVQELLKRIENLQNCI